MLMIDLESARECQKVSEKLYNENRCFKAYNVYSKIPTRKPDSFENIIDLYIERKNYGRSDHKYSNHNSGGYRNHQSQKLTD